jgi:hypothetical protein
MMMPQSQTKCPHESFSSPHCGRSCGVLPRPSAASALPAPPRPSPSLRLRPGTVGGMSEWMIA